MPIDRTLAGLIARMETASTVSKGEILPWLEELDYLKNHAVLGGLVEAPAMRTRPAKVSRGVLGAQIYTVTPYPGWCEECGVTPGADHRYPCITGGD